ncbi:hypothetical protein N7509_006787 [Penicillium cosmopolitanum]|uniref:Macro domain-containing protein n=1 Tax=Penicillium cosmopolitanum TaxID=1131564 RepID=A0A9X0B7S8_9EURO|nr:uncharacterized protein N7509_006787 [Penicillium cosmopolitanum]KAJ5391297.1 hypothetical protein N7509_006787 [Penicillium cosmopolitanum]
MATEHASVKLKRALLHLISLQKEEDTACSHCQGGHSHKRRGQHLLNSDTWDQLEALRRILCELCPDNEIPPEIDEDIDEVIAYRNSHTLLTSTTSIPPSVTLQHPVIEDANPFRLSSWNGDITTLTDVTAIVNAANSGLLGCFNPEHRCIDNVIHSAAGPHLRQACRLIMDWQTDPEPAGLARITPGFHLPAAGVLHTVGPQLRHRETPQPHHKNQLASCYRSCLDAAEMLHPLPDQRKVVAFCCISTGLFAFPSDMAARIAVDTVKAWHLEHPMTSITDVIFNTYLEKDQKIYQNLLQSLQNTQSDEDNGSLSSTSTITPMPPLLLPSLHTTGTIKSRAWIEDADALIISAGAGLSAAAGLDYNSHDLFTKHFPAFRSKGLRRLYDVMGYNGWSSDSEKWGYYFLHLDTVRKWPVSPIYEKLRGLTARFPKKHFIRTSNADGLFVKNGFDGDLVATPQGQYRFLQCFDKCQPDAYVLSDPLVDAALPFIDSKSQVLMDESKIPKCRLCGGDMTLCVRGGTYFNSKPFRDQELAWKKFLRGLENEKDENPSHPPKKVVVLELGVGLNTPGVLRWPNENLVSESPNKTFRLIRIGKEASGCVPWELEEEDLGVGVTGDVVAALDLIIPSV